LNSSPNIELVAKVKSPALLVTSHIADRAIPTRPLDVIKVKWAEHVARLGKK